MLLIQEVDGRWKWKKPPPPSEEKVVYVNPEEGEKVKKVIRKAQTISMREKLLQGCKSFACCISLRVYQF